MFHLTKAVVVWIVTHISSSIYWVVYEEKCMWTHAKTRKMNEMAQPDFLYFFLLLTLHKKMYSRKMNEKRKKIYKMYSI